jgi:hypothetical protein
MGRPSLFCSLSRPYGFRFERRLFFWRDIINPLHPADRIPVKTPLLEQAKAVRADSLDHAPPIGQHLDRLDLEHGAVFHHTADAA